MKRFTASDGVEITYRDEGAGRPLVLLHGLMAHGGFFDRQKDLASHFRLVTVDLRGHGQSAAPGADVTVERAAADIAELADALGLEDAIGIGWSLGATLLWHLLSGPVARRFAGAVVVDMTPCVQNGGGWVLGLSAEHCAQRSAAIAADFPSFAAAAGRAIFADSRNGADWAAAEFQKNDGAAIGSLWQSLATADSRAMLPAIAQPVLIVHGAKSHLYGTATAEYLADAIPRSRRIEFLRSGHAPHIEQPDLFNQAITDFAASLPPIARPQKTTHVQEEAHGS